MKPRRWLYIVPLRLRSLFRAGQVEAELDEELRDHLEHLIETNQAHGMSAVEARYAALRAMDGIEQRKEECRDARKVSYLQDLTRDVRYGVRTLRRNLSLTVVAVLTLALGIGATTAIFSLANTVLLRPLPFPDPDRLVLLQESMPKIVPGKFDISAPDVADFQSLNHVFQEMGAFQSGKVDLTSAGAPLRIDAANVSASLFRTLGVQPALGRAFEDSEDPPGHNVAVLSYALWQGRYGGDPAILGKTVYLDRQPYSVIGVMPRHFEFPPEGMTHFPTAQIWTPIALTPADLAEHGDNYNTGVVGRLKPGISLAAANADVMVAAHQIQQRYYPSEPGMDYSLEASVTPLSEFLVGNTKPLLWLLLGAVGLLLMIACANVANLLLARGAERQKEIAVRVALGAARRRLVRQLLVESTVLALVGGGFGLLAAYGGVKLLARLAAPVLPRVSELTLDWHVLVFAVAISVLCGLLFGTAPALAVTRSAFHDALKESGRGASSGRVQRRVRDLFVVAQMAMALVLVTGSGLLVRSLVRARSTDPGFRPENLVAISITVPATQYRTETQVQSFYDRVLAATRALPGVTTATTSNDTPLNSTWNHTFTVEGHETKQLPFSWHTLVGSGYFDALHIPLVRGRFFSAAEMQNPGHALIISEGMAKHYMGGEDPIGKRVKWGGSSNNNPWYTVVGVVGDLKQGPLDVETKPHTFEPFAQVCQGTRMCNARFLFVRSTRPAKEIAGEIRKIVQSVDPEQPLGPVLPMNEVITRSLAPRRFNTFLLGLFGASALLLAAIGTYGVLSYNVARQQRELGIRMALGARSREILAMVIGKGLRLALLALSIGLVASLALTRVMKTLLFEVSATDPGTFAGVTAIFLAVALLACWIPGRRATRVDPMSALHLE